jgi:hypothetical protein
MPDLGENDGAKYAKWGARKLNLNIRNVLNLQFGAIRILTAKQSLIT